MGSMAAGADPAASNGAGARAVFVRDDPSDEGRLELRFDLLDGQADKLMRRLKDEPLERTLDRLERTLMPKPKQKRQRKKRQHSEPTEQQQGGDDATAKDQGQQASAPEAAADTKLEAAVVGQDGSKLAAASTSNLSAFRQDGTVLDLGKFGQFTIVVDPPRVKDLSVRGRPIVGCPLPAVVDLEFGQGVPVKWCWTEKQAASQEAAANAEGSTESSPAFGTTAILVPDANLVGKELQVTCQLDAPFAKAHTAEVGAAVIASPDRGPFSERQADFAEPTAVDSSAFRLVTYNVLADAYSHTWDNMYEYCAVEHREIDYRLPLLLREVLDYHADLVCLQEVDAKAFDSWQAALGAAGMEGRFTPKAGESITEGCAMFWRTDKFEICDFHETSFRQLCADSQSQWLADLRTAVPELNTTLDKVTTILQLATIRFRSEASNVAHKRIVLANTHSFYHPGAGQVRAIQAKLLTDLLEARKGDDDATVPVICGDLNAQAFDLSLHYLLNGTVHASHPEWATSSVFRWGSKANLARDTVFEEPDTDRYPNVLLQKTPSGRFATVASLEAQVDAIDHSHSWFDKVNVVAELTNLLEDTTNDEDRAKLDALLQRMREHLERDRVAMVETQRKKVEASPLRNGTDVTIGLGANLSHHLSLFSAYGEPKFTNYCRAWFGDIDWILAPRDQLSVAKIAPLPSEEVVSQNVALPSCVFPSDHLSLCCEFRWLGGADQ